MCHNKGWGGVVLWSLSLSLIPPVCFSLSFSLLLRQSDVEAWPCVCVLIFVYTYIHKLVVSICVRMWVYTCCLCKCCGLVSERERGGLWYACVCQIVS